MSILSKLAVIASTILILGALPGRAALGDYETHAIQVLGTPVRIVDVGQNAYCPYRMVDFQKGFYRIHTNIIDKKIAVVGYSRVDGKDLTSSEMDMLLQGNNAGGDWIKDYSIMALQQWSRLDGAKAVYVTEKKELLMLSAEALQDAKKRHLPAEAVSS